MTEYETFDKYLSQSKEIQAFLDERLGLMFEVFKISTLDADAKSFWIEKIGADLEAVLELIQNSKKDFTQILGVDQ